MKTNNSFYRLFVVLLFYAYAASISAEDLTHLRLNYEHHEDGLVTVHVMMKTEVDKGISLGSQNYRLFYNSEELSFSEDMISSSLTDDRYNSATVEEHILFKSRGIQQLKFDDVGFINFSILLLDVENGGKHIDRQWHKIASISFTENGVFNPNDIVLAMPHSTNDYASAYVEMSEWINASETKPITLTIDKPYNMTTVQNKIANDIDLMVGPNPTVDFVYVLAQERLASISLYSLSGEKIQTNKIDSNESKMDLTGRSSGIYLIEIEDQEGQIYFKEIVKQ